MSQVTSVGLPPTPRVQGWLLLGYALLMVPQWLRLGLWLGALTVALPILQIGATAGFWRHPGQVVRLLIVVLALILFVLTVGHQFSVQTVAAFFVLATALKWLEMRQGRDLFVMVFILQYLAAVNFLFKTGPGWAVMALIGILVLFNALASFHAGDMAGVASRGAWRRMLVMTVVALPVVALLFVFFPRIGPLWSVPLVSQATTGMTDHISPGDLARLVQNDQRVFRARFNGPFPKPDQRYWRGLVLDRFADGTWSASSRTAPRPPGKVLGDASAKPLGPGEYEVLMEPSYRRWAFALKYSVPVSHNVFPAPQDLIRFRRPVDSLVRYRMKMVSPGQQSRGISRSRWQWYTRLPPHSDPKAHHLAARMASSSHSETDYVRHLLTYFHNQPFYYTLNPPQYGNNGIDRFLFDQRRGFCAHYASAMAFLLRAAGIPARIVLGYLGGEKGLDGKYLIVRQYDAHAWVEFWLAGRGWVRVDPTAAIDPSRVEKDLLDHPANGAQSGSLSWSAASRYRNSRLLNWMGLHLDALDYAWERWVVNYHGGSQMHLLSRLHSGINLQQMGWISAAIVFMAFLGFAVWNHWLREGRGRDPYQRLYNRWLRSLREGGVTLTGDETPLQAASAAESKGRDYALVARAFARGLCAHYYAGSAIPVSQLKRLVREQKRLNRSVKGHTVV